MSVFSYKVFAGCLYAHIKEGRHCEAIRARSLSPPTPTSMDALGRLRCSRQTTCKCAVLAASTLHQSASGRHEHAQFSLPPPITVEQQQACYINGSLRSAPLQQPNHLQVHELGPGGKHSPTRVQAADTSTHLESTTALHRGAAASLLDQSEVH